jgi:acyl-[acyl-carrier-protein]-phospholipid O-acyltransferase / long-chain-fatty-acid--[acyl-carrier-protein] ligase
MPKRKRRLRISSFAYLNICQFCGALNDNLYKLIIVFLLVHLHGERIINVVMIITGTIFIVPYLLFSVPSGTLSDRYSKRNIIVLIKAAEVLVMLAGVLAFWLESAILSYIVLFFMSTIGAIFSPSKYGIIPEIVERPKISRANGILTGLTVIATILGSFLASALTQLTGANYPLIAWFAVVISVLGLAGAIGIGYTPPSGATGRLSLRVVREIMRVLKRSRMENYLLTAIIGSALFYTIGSYMQLNILPYSIQSLGLTEVEGNYIFSVAAIGIALGAYTSGRLAGQDVELGIGPVAGIGIFAFMVLLYVFQHSLTMVVILFLILGFMGGLYLVPFDAYIQVASPDQERGENVAASNILAFLGIAFGVFLLFLFAEVFRLTAAGGFVGMALITVTAAILLIRRLSDTLVRLWSHFRFSKNHRLEVAGRESLPHDRPSLLLCRAPSWTYGMAVMTVLQQRYMKFAIEQPSSLTQGHRWLCRFGKVALYTADPLAVKGRILRWLCRGYSVTLLPQSVAGREEELLATCRALAEESKAQLVAAEVTFASKHEPVPVFLKST